MDKKPIVILFFPKVEEHHVHWHRVPLSLLSIARMLENEYEVKIIDERVNQNSYDTVSEFIGNSICFGVTALTGTQIKYALKITDFVRENAPQCPIVWGGWHPSILPEQTATHPNVDVVARGQGEITFKKLVQALRQRISLDNISGITFKKDGVVVSTPDRQLCDVNEFPPIPYHLIDVEKYIGLSFLGADHRVINYISSQGCPHRCAFCADAAVYRRKWTGLSAGRVVDELEALVRQYGVKGFFFEDSNFFANSQRVKDICKGIIERGLDIIWEAEVRTERFVKADEEMKELLRKSGCYQLLVGAESGSQDVLNLIQKDASVEDTVEFVKQASEKSIVPLLSVMVGVPEVDEDLSTTIRFCRDIKLAYPKTRIYWFFYTPYPGSILYDSALRRGLDPPTSLEGWSRYVLDEIQTPWVSEMHRKLPKILTFYFTLAYPDIYLISPDDSKIMRFLKKIVSLLAFYRLKLNWFRVPVDFHLTQYYIEHKSKFVRGF